MALDRSAGGGRARAGWVALALLAIGLLAAGPFLTRRAVGTSEAYNYSLSLADAVTQLRAGVVPPLVGQTPYAFNGRIHPLRNAPYLAALAGALDLASGRRLGFWELQNLSLALSLMGAAFACYFSVRWGAGGGRILSLGLAAAYAWCPALLAAAYASDLYMTVAAAPFLPLALGACLRQVRQPAVRHDLLLAGALAAAWLAHPPVALWLTGVAGLLRLAIFLRQPSGRALAGLGAGALLFAVLAGFGFVSAATATRGLTPLAPAGGFQQDYARVVLENLRDAFPAALLPVSRRVQDLGSFQLGYLAWLLLGSALVGLLRSRREGWDARRISVLALTAGALLLLVLCLPIPGLTHALWLRLPPAVHLLTNIWPMQRLYLVATAAIVLAAAATRADGIPRRAGALLLGAGLAWTLGQARPFLIQGYRQRWSAAETAASHRDSNIDLSAVSYAFFGLPDDYTSGVIDPWTQLRLVPLGASPAAVPETADLARAPIVQRGVLRRSSPESDQLEPELTLEPGRRYVLQLEFLTSPIRVYLKFSGEALARSYRLPDAGGPAGFGMAPEAGHDLVLWTALDHPEKVRASITPWGGGADDRPAAGFARFTLRAIDPARLPVRLESFVPLRCAVDAPRDGMALETFRQYLPGYTARVDDRTVAVLRSPAGRVLVPVPRGRSEVRVSYVGSPLLLASFWLSAVGWAGFIAGLAAAAFPAGRSGLAAAAGRARVGVVRHRISVTLGVAALALLAAGAAWRRRPPAPAAAGPLRIRALLPLGQAGRNQPLVVLGHAAGGTIIFLNLTDDRHVRVGADAWGRLYETGPLPVDYDRIQEWIVSASALYPPDDARFRSLDPADQRRLRGELRVDLNGRSVLAVEHPPQDGETTDVHLGENPVGGSFAGPRFSGDLIGADRLPLSRELGLAPGQVLRLRLGRLEPGGGRQPLVTLAGGGRSAVVYAVGESPRLVRVGLFSFDGSWDEMGDVPVAADGSVALEIRTGRRDYGRRPSALTVSAGGRKRLGASPLRPLLDPLVATTGRNLLAAVAVNADFAGEALDAAVAEPPAAGKTGPYDLVAWFPANRAGRAEPLLVSGPAGAADLVYVAYADAGHARFGVDHWGHPGTLGPLVALDTLGPHEIEISLGSLYPEEGDPEWAGLAAAVRRARKSEVTIRLDGRTVLAAPLAAYPSRPDQIVVGANRIGGSSCEPEFSGRIVFAGRRPPGEAAPP